MDAVARAPRPAGIVALSAFFLAGALVCLAAITSLLSPGGPLEPMWRLNPQARVAFAQMGPWTIALMAAVALACGLSGAGLWRGATWGRRLAIGLLAVNLVGNLANATLGGDPRTLIGLPIGGALLLYLAANGPVKRFFAVRPT